MSLPVIPILEVMQKPRGARATAGKKEGAEKISGGSVVEAEIPSQLVDNKGSSQSPRQNPIFSMAKGFGDLPTQNGLASKRTEQLKEILNHVK